MKASQKPCYTVICNANGCVFLLDTLTKRDADRTATSHINAYSHDVSIIKEKEG